MSEPFIERWTEARVLADEGVSRDHLERAIDWVVRAAPENGVDLVPWWEARLKTETEPMRRFRQWRWPIGLAACLFVGLALGAAAGAGFGSRSAPLADHYSTRQQQLMFSLLDPTRELPAVVYQSATTELVGCFECHDALRRRVATSGVRPVAGDQSNATPTLQRRCDTSATRGMSLCRQNRLWQSGLQFMVWQECCSAATTPRSSIIAFPSHSRRPGEKGTINRLLAWNVPPSALRRSAMAS